MDVFGIIGWPVEHSLSPYMHNAAFKALGLKAVYGLFPVKPEELEKAVSGLKALHIHGVSVTIPHKEKILSLLDEIDPVAFEIGAVNTVVLKEERLLGFNTDWIGVKRALEEVTPLAGKRAVVIGAGGASRAVVYALCQGGAKVVIYNRTFEKAQNLARIFGVEANPWEELPSAEGDLLLQTTSVGLNEDRSPVPKEILPRFKVAMDIVYTPLKTTFLKEAKEAGCQTINGLKMLVYQGAEQFRLFTGKAPPVKLMEEAALSALKGDTHGKERN